MQVFSGLYKKMCGKAEELQDIWEPEEWDECCKKGDHEDGIAKEYHPGMLSDEEKKSFKDNHTWLPTSDQLRERAWTTWGLDSLRKLKEKEYIWFLEDEDREKEVKKYFEEEEVMYVLSLMFVMEKDNSKEWNYEEEDWIKIKT